MPTDAQHQFYDRKIGRKPRYTVVYEGDPTDAKILSGEPAPGEAVAVTNGDLVITHAVMLNALKAALPVLLCADDAKIPRLQIRLELVEAAIAKAEGR